MPILQILFSQLRKTEFSFFVRHLFAKTYHSARYNVLVKALKCQKYCTVSNMYILKPKASLIEYDWNLPSIPKNEKEYEERVKVRRINLNVAELCKEINVYNQLNQECKGVHKEINAIKALIKQKSSLEDGSSSIDLEEFKNKEKTLRGKEKSLRKSINDAKDKLEASIHKIPTVLHSETPVDNHKFETFGSIRSFGFPIQNHILLGYINNCLEFSIVSPHAYYLKGKLANLELSLINYFGEQIKMCGFIQASCPDFCKSTIYKYCQSGIVPFNSTFRLDEGTDLVLRGGASFEAFVSHFVGSVVLQEGLPICWYSSGRFYGNDLFVRIQRPKGLFSVVQSTRIHCFAACKDAMQAEEVLTKVIDCTLNAYENLGLAFRTKRVRAKDLKPIESLRVEIEVWSPSAGSYVPCAHLSSYGDLLSKQLMMTSGTSMNSKKFPLHIVSGPLLSVPPVVACIMENMQNSDGTFSLPEILKGCHADMEASTCVP